MADNTITLQIQADVKKALDGISSLNTSFASASAHMKKVADTTEDGAKSMAQGFTDVTKKVSALIYMKLAEWAVKAFRAFADGIGEMISKSAESEASMNMLIQSMYRAGTASKSSLGSMIDYVEQLKKTTTFDDDLIISQLSVARAFTKSDEQARQLIGAATNLSAAMGIDLATAQQYLSRSLDGTAGRLVEMVPQLRDVSAESLKSGAAISIINAQFAGAAASQINTYAGSLKQVGKNFEDVEKSIGALVTTNPAVIQMNKIFAAMFGKLAEWLDENRAAIMSFINQGILLLIKAIEFLMPSMKAMIVALDGINVGFKLISTTIDNTVMAFKFVKMGVTAITGSFKEAVKAGEEWDASVLKADQSADKFAKSAMKFWDDATNPNLGEDSQKKIDKWFKDITNKFETFKLPQSAKDALNPQLNAEIEAQISWVEFGKAFLATMTAQFQALAANISGGFEGGKKMVTDVAKQLSGAAASAFMGPVVGPIVTAIAAPLIDLLAMSSDQMKTAIQGFFQGLFQTVMNLITNLAPLIDAFVAGLIYLLEHFDVIVEALVKAAPRIALAIAKAVIIGAVVWAGLWYILGAQAVKGVFKAMGGSAKETVVTYLSQFMKGLGDGLKSILEPIKQALISAITSAFAWLKPLFDSIVVYFLDMLKSIGTMFQPVVDAIASIANAFSKVISDIADPVIGLAASIAAPIKDFGSQIANAASGFVNGILDGATRFVDKILKKLGVSGKGGPLIGGTLGEAGNGVSSSLKDVASGIKNVSIPGLSLVADSGSYSNNYSSANVEALLVKLISVISSQTQTVNVQLNKDTLAKAILSLNQDNRRLA